LDVQTSNGTHIWKSVSITPILPDPYEPLMYLA
jgi:hypothetical protein